jgi:hypothetical protein
MWCMTVFVHIRVYRTLQVTSRHVITTQKTLLARYVNLPWQQYPVRTSSPSNDWDINNSKAQNATFVTHSTKCEQLSLPREVPRMNSDQSLHGVQFRSWRTYRVAFVVERLSAVSSAEAWPWRTQVTSRGGKSCDTLADISGHGLISTGSSRGRPTTP